MSGIHRYSYVQAYERVCAMANALEKLGVRFAKWQVPDDILFADEIP